jgi:phosphomethylpyrimidine synthase
MPAKGVEDMSEPGRQKIYVEGDRPDLRIPFVEVTLSPTNGPDGPVGNPPVRLYDTSGPGSEPEVGLPPLRLTWIEARADTEPYEGRPVGVRDDGRAAVRRGGAREAFRGERRAPRRGFPGKAVTQMAYARRGDLTPEMAFVAAR